jgi:O-antigen ligase
MGKSRRFANRQGGPSWPIVAIGLAGIVTLAGLFLLQKQAGAFDILAQQNVFEDLRAQIFPVLRRMVGQFWVVGSGFGGFEHVYRIYEPTELLGPRYVNHAHDDWIELIIEGGTPAALLLLAGLAWLARSVSVLALRGGGNLLAAVYWAAVIILIGFGSLVDYPLRTPLFAVVAVWLAAMLGNEARDALQKKQLDQTAS